MRLIPPDTPPPPVTAEFLSFRILKQFGLQIQAAKKSARIKVLRQASSPMVKEVQRNIHGFDSFGVISKHRISKFSSTMVKEVQRNII